MLTLKYGSSYMTPMNIQAGHDYPFYNRLIKAMYNDRKYNSLEEYTEYLMDISARYYVNFLKKKAEPVLDYDREAYNDYEDLRIRIWTDGYKCDMEEFAKRFHC